MIRTDKHKIFIIAHDWHTGFVLPASEICQQLPDLKARFPEANYLEFGWGDQQYFQSETTALSAKLKAVLIPGRSTMHVVALPEVEKPFTDAEPIVPMQLPLLSYQALMAYLVESFYRTESGKLVKQVPGRYPDSQFYLANGLYHLFNTCNKWTAQGLRAASIEIQPRFKLSARSVLKEVDNSRHVIT